MTRKDKAVLARSDTLRAKFVADLRRALVPYVENIETRIDCLTIAMALQGVMIEVLCSLIDDDVDRRSAVDAVLSAAPLLYDTVKREVDDGRLDDADVAGHA